MVIAARAVENSSADVSRGILLMLVGALIIPVLDALAKILVTEHGVSPGEVSLIRLVQQALYMLPLLLFTEGPRALKVRRLGLHLLRGALLGVGGVFFFAALRFMPLADTTAIFFVEPMLVTVLSAVILGETVGWRRAVAVGVGFGGAMLIIRPSFADLGFIAVLPVLCAVCIAVYSILSRLLADTGSALAMHVFGGIGGTLALALLMVFGSALDVQELSLTLPTRLDTWLIFLATGIVGLVGHTFFAQAFRLAPASTLAPFAYAEIVSAVILGYLVFGSFPDTLKWAGIAIIVGSGAYIFHRERLIARRAPTNAAER